MYRINLYKRLEEVLGDVRSKTLFSGVGIFYQDHMFALYKKGGFYLRAKEVLSDDLVKIGAIRWDNDGVPSNLKVRDYYLIPSDYITDDRKASCLLDLILRSLSQIEEEKLVLELEKARLIRNLPNMSVKYERLFAKVGITTISELREIGAGRAYVLLKTKGFFVTKHLFWKTYAALKNKHVEVLTKEEIEEGFKEINALLAQANLRAMKYKPK